MSKSGSEIEARAILAIAAEIKPILAGKAPSTQGAVLAELVSIWLSGWEPGIRDEILRDWLPLVAALVETNSKILRQMRRAAH